MKNRNRFAVMAIVLLSMFASIPVASADTLTLTRKNAGEVYGSWGFLDSGPFYGIVSVELNGQPTIAIATSELPQIEIFSDTTFTVTPVTDLSSGYALSDGIPATRDMLAKAAVVLRDSVAYYSPDLIWDTIKMHAAAARQEMTELVLESPIAPLYESVQGALYYTTETGQLDYYNSVQTMDVSSIDPNSIMLLVPGSQMGMTYSDFLVLKPTTSSSTTTGTGSGDTTTTTRKHGKSKKK